MEQCVERQMMSVLVQAELNNSLRNLVFYATVHKSVCLKVGNIFNYLKKLRNKLPC